MTGSPIRFGVNNHVERAVLTSTPATVTDLEFLKNDLRGRLTKFNNLQTPTIVINGTIPETVKADFFSIPASNLQPNSTVKLELFAAPGDETDLLNMSPIGAGDPIPLGIWSAGVDPYGEENRLSMGNIITHWFDSTVTFMAFRLTITHGFDIITPTPSLTRRQDESTGIFAVEGENATSIGSPVGPHNWSVVADAAASGGSIMYKTGTGPEYDYTVGPVVNYSFEATRSGVHDVWIRIKTANDSNSIYCIFEGNNKTCVFDTNIASYTWVLARNITLTAETTNLLTFSARDWFFNLDKIQIQPTGTDAPTGTGAAESGFGTVISRQNVSLRMLTIGNKIEMSKNFSHGNTVRFMDEPDIKRTASGFAVQGKVQNKARLLTMNLNQMSEGDRLKLVEMETALAGRSFIVSAYPDSASWTDQVHTMLGKFTQSLEYTHRTANLFTTQLEIAEV